MGNGVKLHLAGSLLQLRGETCIQAPIVDGHGNVLVFNGEIYEGLNVQPHENDTVTMSEALSTASNDEG